MRKVSDKQILLAVKERIRTGENHYICCAIEASCIGTKVQKSALRKWVATMLQGFPTYSLWLAGTHPDFYFEGESSFYKAGRLAWLDWMIANCGDE